MAISAGIALVSTIAGAVMNNQTSQRQKGINSQLMADLPDPTKTAPPSTAAATQSGVTTAANAAAQQRQRALSAYGMNDTILTSPRGAGPAPAQRKTLLGL